jgi:hypothetical protein
VQISKALIEGYLDHVASYIGDVGYLPDDLNEYNDSILDLKKFACERGDLDILRVAIDYLLTHPEIDVSSFAAIHHQFDPDEMKDFLCHIRAIIWPQASALGLEEIINVEFINISRFDWWEMRKSKPVST